MATTKNHKITTSLKKAIDYVMGDKTEDILKGDVKDSVAYALDDKTGKVIYKTIHSVFNCGTGHPVNIFNRLINKYGKAELEYGSSRTKDGAPVLAWHYHQNFEGHVDPVIANEIGQRLAYEVFNNFSVVVGTHTNTENTHNHIIICAWDLDGHKWHQHNAAYRHIREVSDRLCEEYGLSVLRDTQKQKLIKWKDEDGNVHYYEPTKRKNEIIRQREKGEMSTDDVGSYRNTIPYEQSESKEETNREIVRRDIDRILPVATSYEHLLNMLRQIGYTVNDKKKNGEWLKHISFQPPTADKGTRDYKIGDGIFYLRENLEQVIDEFNADRELKKKNLEQENPHKPEMKIPPFFDEYIYGETVLADIDDNVRTVKEADGRCYVVERKETEKTVIFDVRVKDGELHLIDTSELERIIKEQKTGKRKMSSNKKEEIIIGQIRENFHVLRFMEKESLYSQSQINMITESTWEKYNECMKSLDTLESLVNHLEFILQVPSKIEIIETRMERMIGNADYVENEMEGDTEQLKTYQNVMKRYKLDSRDGIEKLATQVSRSRKKIGQLQEILSVHRERLSEYDRCVKVLSRIDREQGRENEEIVQEYQKIKRKGEQESKQTEDKREKRKAAER